jgi:hypothetical protein
VLYPGEDEVQALAEGALRVLFGEEQPLRFDPSSQMAATAGSCHPAPSK